MRQLSPLMQMNPPDDCRVEDEMSTGLINTHTARGFCITCSLKNNAFSVLHCVIDVALHYYMFIDFRDLFFPWNYPARLY